MKKIKATFLLFILLAVFLTGCGTEDDGDYNVSDGKVSQTTTQTESPAQAEDNKVGSRKNPVPLGSTVSYDGTNTIFDKYKVDITFTEVIRGENAWQLVKQGNEFNEPAPEGKEYLIIKVRIKAYESENDEKIDINNASFDLVSKDGVKYDDFTIVSGVEPELKEMYAGAEQEGYIVFTVNVGDEPTVVFLDRNNGGVWFALK